MNGVAIGVNIVLLLALDAGLEKRAKRARRVASAGVAA